MVLELYYNDHVEYPAASADGIRLGVDARCLGTGGFSADQSCAEPYMAVVPMHPDSPASDYQYFRCSPEHYLISFNLSESQGGFSAGENFATENGTGSTISGIDCRPLAAVPIVPVDSDADGLPDDQEGMYGTDFMNADSDGDGYLDGAEVQNGYDPNGAGQLTL